MENVAVIICPPALTKVIPLTFDKYDNGTSANILDLPLKTQNNSFKNFSVENIQHNMNNSKVQNEMEQASEPTLVNKIYGLETVSDQNENGNHGGKALSTSGRQNHDDCGLEFQLEKEINENKDIFISMLYEQTGAKMQGRH